MASRPVSEHDLLRAERIRETVVRAARGSAFYRELYAAHGVDPERFRGLCDMPTLPPVSRADLVRAGTRALCLDENDHITLLQTTSGTTSAPLTLYRTAAEAEFLREFGALLARPAAEDAAAPLVLQFPSLSHGRPIPVPSRAFPIQCSARDPASLARTLHLLGTEFSIPGVEPRATVLAGSHEEILALTAHVAARGIPARRDFAIRAIQITGSYLTRRWQRLLEQTWDARVNERFSLSEAGAGASFCADCRAFHFDAHVVAEVVGPDGRPVERGTGSLLVTTLHPFIQAQPLIRYRTGDLFQVRAGRCARRAFRFLGREHQAAYERGGGEPLLWGVDVIEALDGHPEVARVGSGRAPKEATLPRALGTVRQEDGSSTVTLTVFTAVPLALYPRRRHALRRRISRALLRRSPHLAARVASGAVRLKIRFAHGDAPAGRPNLSWGTLT